jgi:hypothetical protein
VHNRRDAEKTRDNHGSHRDDDRPHNRLTLVRADVPIELNRRTPQGRGLRRSVSAPGRLRGRPSQPRDNAGSIARHTDCKWRSRRERKFFVLCGLPAPPGGIAPQCSTCWQPVRGRVTQEQQEPHGGAAPVCHRRPGSHSQGQEPRRSVVAVREGWIPRATGLKIVAGGGGGPLPVQRPDVPPCHSPRTAAHSGQPGHQRRGQPQGGAAHAGASAAMTLDVYTDLFESDLDDVAVTVSKMCPRWADSP